MYRLITIIICIFSCINMAQSQNLRRDSMPNNPIVIVGAWHMPPFFISNFHGKPDGLSLEIMTTILQRKRIPYVIKIESWDQSKADIRSGKADLTCMMVSSENSKQFKFGASIRYAYMCAVYRIGDKPILGFNDMIGKSVFLIKPSRSNEIILKDSNRYKIHIVYDNIEQAFQKLSAGENNAIFCNSITARFMIKTLGINNLTYREFSLPPQENRMAGNNEKLLKTMEQELYQMKLDGTYDKIIDKWVEQYKVGTIPKGTYLFLIFMIIVAVFLYLVILFLRRRMKKSERIVIELYQKYKTIFENAMIGIQHLDKEGNMMEANDVFCQQFGIKDKSKLLDQHINIYANPLIGQHFHKEHPQKYTGIIKWDFDELKKFDYYNLGLPHGIKYFETQINPLFDKDNHLLCIIVTSRDVTDMIMTQNELEREKEKALESDRLKSEFLANMSHEIRTPLNAIVGFADLLKDNYSTEEKKMFSQQINKNSHTLIELINNILDMSRIEAGKTTYRTEKFDISDLFVSLYSTLNTLDIKQDIDFSYEIPYPEYFIISDPHFITQIVNNFVTNAFKYTHHGHVKMSYAIEDNGLKVMVEDTGVGIPQDNLNKVFTRFEKLGSFQQGTGLGLAICKSVIDMCHGKIGADSTLGKGSTFWAWFPIE